MQTDITGIIWKNLITLLKEVINSDKQVIIKLNYYLHH